MIRIAKYVVVLLILSLVVVLISLLRTLFSSPREVLPELDIRYKDASLPTETRVEALLSSMTLREKVAQMALVDKNSIPLADVATYGVGAVLSGAGAKPEDNTAEGWKNMVDGYTAASRASRLAIPILYGVDATHGHGNVPGATVFPHQIGLGASDDTALVRRVGRATGEELLATSILWNFAPSLDLPHDMRWGRVYETFGDDSERVAALGAAYIDGMRESGVLATAKHYVGAGAMTWDTSTNKNFRIDQGVSTLEKTALEDHLAPFQAAINAGVRVVMAGLNTLNGKKLSAQGELLTKTLREEMGFNGVVVSDWYGVYELPGGEYNAAVAGINAGIDLVMLPFDYKNFIANVTRAVTAGEVQQNRIDDAVRRILALKFDAGLFDKQGTTPLATFGSNEHRALAREAVAKSAVLLKNNDALPIKKTDVLIRVAGSAADNVGMQAGAWTVEWQGVDGNWLPGATSILAGIRNGAQEGQRVEYSQNGVFTTSDMADVGIAVVGERPYAEGWGDRELPTLSEEDLRAIAELKKTSRRVAVVLITGRPLLIADELPSWDALLVAWLPGSEGAGVADVLFGAVSPTATLPLPWPRIISQVPTVGNASADGTLLLYRRDYGLTY